MALGKAVNKKSFYGASEMGGGTPEIEMPKLEEQTPIAEAPNPWDEQQAEASAPEASQSEPVEETTESPQETSVAANMRALREAREKAERERDEVIQILKMQAQQQPKEEPHIHEEEDDFGIDPEALVEGKQLKRMYSEMKQLKKELNQYKSQSSESIVETKIKSQFPDFDKVVSQENVAVLNELYPEIAKTIRDTSDMYSKAVSAYKIMKQFGIAKDEIVDRDLIRAQKNAVKPRPLASVNPQQGDSPLSKANAFANGELTAEVKEQLRKEMFAARRNY